MVTATMRKAGGGNVDAAKAALASVKTGPTIDVESAASPAGLSDFQKAALQGDASPTPQQQPQPANPSRAVAHQRSNVGTGFEGEFDSSDIKFPVLKVVQGSGPMSQKFQKGATVLGDEVLFEALPPNAKPDARLPIFRFLPVKIKKQYREKLSNDAYTEGQRPRIFSSPIEVEEAGGVCGTWNNDPNVTLFQPSGTCYLLIEQPEGVSHPAFGIELNGKAFAPAVYYSAGSSYNDFVKTIVSGTSLSLMVEVGKNEAGRPIKEPMPFKRFWTAETKYMMKGKNWVYGVLPRLTAEETTDEVRDFCKTILGAAAESAPEDAE